MDLVLNINKPPGPTSFAAVARVRRLCRVRRVGHAGTLDPAASGVLLVLIGQATRVARYLEPLTKEYQAVIRLGLETDTDDLEGDVTGKSPVPQLERAAVEKVLSGFTGEIDQVPPRYSALKKDGVPLYRLARQGRPADPAPRKVNIQGIELLSLSDSELGIRVTCSKGTYVRSLARDIGRALGCGGTLAGLIRRAVGRFGIEEAVPLEALDAGSVAAKGISIDRALDFLPRVDLDDSEAGRARHGNIIDRTSGLEPGSVFRLRHQGSLVAVGRESGGMIRPECVFTAPER